MQLLLYFCLLSVQRLDFLTQFLHLCQNSRYILTSLLELRDGLRYLILLRLPSLNLADDITALLVECQSSINLLVIALATHSQTSLALLSILSDKLYI